MTRLIKAWLFAALASGVISMVSPAPAGAATPPSPPAAAPVNLTATAGTATVVLTWAPVDGATGYQVFTGRAGVWDATPPVTVPRSTFTSGGLANGTPYSYKVAAFNRAGTGPLSNEVKATPVAPPMGVTAVAGNQQVVLSWQAAAGALTYSVFRSISGDADSFEPIATDIGTRTFVDTVVVNRTKYLYRLRALAPGAMSVWSARVSALPLPPPPISAPTDLAAQAGNAQVVLTWAHVYGALSYRVYRTAAGEVDAALIAKPTATTFTDTDLTNGTTSSYRVAGRNIGGDGPSAVVTATPVAPPGPLANLTATAGDHQVTLSWTPVVGATSYNIYRGTRSGRRQTLVASGIAAPPFVDRTAENGPTYYYKITAVNDGGESHRSNEASATPEGPPLVVDAQTQAAFRLLRQSTWGARPGDVDHVKAVGAAAFVAEQLAAPTSPYPTALHQLPVETSQEYFMQLALTAPDQLRQRVAWALHKIWVVSAVDVDSAPAIVTYYRLLMNGAFGNFRALMHDITLNPAMGRYLNMLNNRSEQVTGAPPSENYARELMQLFTLGLARLKLDGTPMLDGSGAPLPAYSETDVKELARILTGWTFGGGSGQGGRNQAKENYTVPMAAVEAYHDAGAKTFLGQQFSAGQSASEDVEHALDVLFNHPNVGPFISRQLIQQLVTSNPSAAYVADIAAVFNDNGAGVRGDLGAVVSAILLHPEASLTAPTSGKLTEPVLLIVSMLRTLDAFVADHPFMSDKAEEMGQKVFYPPSVFSYFSPGYRVRGTGAPGPPLLGPEFQILTSVTTLVRANFVSAVLDRRFGDDVAVDLSPFTTLARDAGALVDYCNLVFMGGRMSPETRREMIAAVKATPVENVTERAQTAIYLTLVIAQSQVDR